MSWPRSGHPYDNKPECTPEGNHGERWLSLIAPFDDPWVIAGQGTIDIEILEDFPEVDTAIVPVSGGGLIDGISLALKTANPESRVIGISPKVSAPMFASLEAEKPIEIEEKNSLADTLLGGIGLDNAYTFSMVQQLVDTIVLAEEKDIAAGMTFAYGEHHLVVEGSGAAGLSLLLKNGAADTGENIVIIVSGGNVDARLHHDIVTRKYTDKTKLVKCLLFSFF